MTEFTHFDDKVIVITPSILKNLLYEFKAVTKNICGIFSSAALATMSVATLVTVAAEGYQKIFGISGAGWQAIFFLIFVVAIIKFISNLILLAIKWWNDKIITIDDLITYLTKNT